ncbi:sodium-coupled monocarboxylate transporter 1-like isoform X2 [Dermacentor andersoni]|uniref:sodium-coupled monocarboxylate transporter 1-like isoform X2 n=1 Tax=Dermacentor andersoni TaxID=34620 RepID=UPI0024165BC1|nr:sodium-coupled monocarboxylate transporter 1-like isoform X2 [Dermacentor andersoni]
MALRYFHAADYFVLVVVLGISSFIGVYFAWKDRRSTNKKDFFGGSKQLQMCPVAMSMIASFMSAIAILGIPAENFLNGSQFMVSFISIIIASVLAAHVFMPVFYDMDMISVNQYLEKRFNSMVIRKFASALIVIEMCFFMGVVLYGPSLALGSVTGLPVWLSIVLNGSVCAFYTTLGGIKAVVWTDVMQILLMIFGLLIVSVKGFILTGGPNEVFNTVRKHGLLEFFDMSLDFQKTFTFWSVVFGTGINWMTGFCTNQVMVQRYCSLSSTRKARTALYINMVGIIAILTTSSLCGLLLFALYHHCDPVKASIISKYDQLMPYFVMDTLGHLPGITGLFVTAVYSGSLSTLSSGYNALAAITWEDFLKPVVKLSPTGVMWAMKAIAAGFGLIAVAIAFLSGGLPSILSTALLSMFTGLAMALWVAVGRLLYPARPTAARTTLGACTLNYTVRVPPQRTYYSGGIYDLYNVSYMWIPVISFFVTLVIAIFFTIICGFKKSADVDPSFIAPCMRKIYLKTKTQEKQQPAREPKHLPLKPEEKPYDRPQEFSVITSNGTGYVNNAMTDDDAMKRTVI